MHTSIGITLSTVCSERVKRENVQLVLCCVVCKVAATDWAASDPQRARKLGRASYIVSTAGIVTMVIVVAIVVAVYYNDWMCCSYYYCFQNVCYHHYSSNYTSSECQKKNGYYDGDTCWYN